MVKVYPSTDIGMRDAVKHANRINGKVIFTVNGYEVWT